LEPPAVEHHAIVDDLPALSQPLQSEADFWIDSDNLRAIEEELGQIEQMLAAAHDQTGLTQVRADYGFDGTGQTVAVIDSGIAYDHAALGGGFGANYRVVGGWDFTGENDADPYDDGPSGGHGTHVAGIIGGGGGSDNGVAPGVDLVALRVFDDAGAGYFSWVENALNWIHDNKNSFENPITAVNLSLGVASWNSDAIPNWANLEDEFAHLEADGIFIAVSAGNSFTSFNTPGLSYPAASPYVIPVASVDDSGLLSYFSQRNARVIAAPGRGIISTVPDYAGNNNGIVDDYASFSGTSMAAPYVAGASVLIREAMEFVGTTNITQDMIYDQMIATADSFFDSATSAYYNRLNLEAAIDALMPEDDYGSTVGSAYNLGTINASVSTSSSTLMSGAITTLDDVDYFKFTAASTGTVTFTASNMTYDVGANWDVPEGTGTWSGANNEILTVDVVAGQEYTVGFSSNDGLGYYDFDITAESTFSYTDWGTISFSQLQGVSIAGESWFRVATNADGYFTTEALFDSAGGQISLELFNSSLQLIDSGNAAAGESRVDYYGAVGDELYIKAIGSNFDVDFRLTNLVSINGTAVQVNGTAGDDTFAFAAGSTHQISVNDVSYSFASVSIAEINFDGVAGSDSISMTGTASVEAVILQAGNATMLGSGFEVNVTNTETIRAYGGGGDDRADFYDSVGDDRFIGRSTYAQMSGDGFFNYASGFDRVYAYATAGGADDRADFYDSVGDDRFVGKSTYAQMSGDGFFNYASGFGRVYAYATAGGADDRADFYDSAGDDRFVGKSTYAQMSGDGFFNYASGFGRVYAYATAGGADDRADFYDSAGDDRFVGKSTYAQMSGDGFFNYTNGFGRVYAYATAGGTDDRADFYDSAGNDRFVGKSTYAQMSGDGFFNYTNGFDRVYAYATAGGEDDRADFYDSAGNDRFYAWATYAQMLGDGFFTFGTGFDRVYAYATAGGSDDRAYLFGSAGADTFISKITVSWMSSSDYFNYTSGFERVSAFAGAGGFDRAYLYDSSGDDTLIADDDLTVLSGVDHYTSTVGFAEQVAYSLLGGNDTSDVDVIDGVFTEIGDWNV